MEKNFFQEQSFGDNEPLTISSGIDFAINKNVKNYGCPDKFIEAFNLEEKKALEYAEEHEIYYFNLYKKEKSDSINYGWNSLSLQEKKVINGLERFKIPAYIGYRRSFKDGKDRVGLNDKPVFALLEIASACNIKCPFCFQSDSTFTTKEFMGIVDTSFAFYVIDEIEKNKIRGITIASRGEPLICKDLGKILNYISQKENIIEVKLNTNAKRLTTEILDEIMNSKVNMLVISTDHYQKLKYEEYRKGSKFENFIDNISRINQIREKHNREDNFYTRASGVSVDPDMDREEYDNFYTKYLDESGTVGLQKRWNTYLNSKIQHSNACGLPFERLYIWYDGTTNPCDTDYKSFLSPGKLGEISLKECWQNLSKLRSDMLAGKRNKLYPCDRCGNS